jgi:hypothetical protein
MGVVMLLTLLVGFTDRFGESDAANLEGVAIVDAVLAGAERESLDPVMVLSIIAQESSFDADPCDRRMALDRVISREPVEGHPDREVLTWRCGSESGTRAPCSRTVWEVEERDGDLFVNTCPAGEVGYMQVLRSSQWAQAGYPIPGLDEVLSRRASERRAQLLRPEVNIALGCAELAAHREASHATAADPWWEWVGSYNTGTAHGEGAKRYARRILGRYAAFCSMTVADGENVGPLRTFWSGCAPAEDALADLR